MLIVISPAKTLDFESAAQAKTHTQPAFLNDSEILIDQLTTLSPADLEKLMGISPKLAELNVERYHNWSRPFNKKNSKHAVHAFKGDVYNGLEADSMTDKQLDYAQDHLRILSGLYGVLRPLDLMQPYRLEMGIKLANSNGGNLYQFWDKKITNNINKQLKSVDSKYLVNLASNEYFKAVHNKEVQVEIVTPVFRDWKNDQYKMISFFAKTARGRMAAWILKNKVKSLKKLTQFDVDGYSYSEADSSPLNPVFLRKQV